MAKSAPTHKVVHPKLYLAVKGKMQKIEVGTPLVLTDEQAKHHGKKVKKIVNIPTLQPGQIVEG